MTMFISGPWTTEEEDLLTNIVQSLTVDQSKDRVFGVPWTIVSERMGYRRSRHQCRIKWQDGLSKRVGRVGAQDIARWGAMEQTCLLQECVTPAAAPSGNLMFTTSSPLQDCKTSESTMILKSTGTNLPRRRAGTIGVRMMLNDVGKHSRRGLTVTKICLSLVSR